jgi:hypothetical protein
MTTINKSNRGISVYLISQPGAFKISSIFLKRYAVIKRLALLLIFGLAYPVSAVAEDLADMPSVSGPGAGAQGVPYDSPSRYSPWIHDHVGPPVADHNLDSGQNALSHGKPLIMVPVPLPNNSMPGYGSAYGFQHPGSYMPRDTPLHRFNGYVVCNPPDLPNEAPAGTTSGAAAQSLVKITSTRSLAAPAQSQPCPVYTINGEIPKQQGYATTTMPAPGPRPRK